MGLFGRKKKKFVPDFTISEYDNWLNYLDCGGTSQEWEQIKKSNKWIFPESETEKFFRYQKEVKPIANRYYDQMKKIQQDWSVLHNLNDYTGARAKKFEKDCLANIDDYKIMREIDTKYGQETANNIPALKRLAMLYEKQGRFEDAINVSKQACSFGMDEKSRLVRMLKKSGRVPTVDEEKLLQS